MPPAVNAALLVGMFRRLGSMVTPASLTVLGMVNHGAVSPRTTHRSRRAKITV
jgi:hypothetical protein